MDISSIIESAVTIGNYFKNEGCQCNDMFYTYMFNYYTFSMEKRSNLSLRTWYLNVCMKQPKHITIMSVSKFNKNMLLFLTFMHSNEKYRNITYLYFMKNYNLYLYMSYKDSVSPKFNGQKDLRIHYINPELIDSNFDYSNFNYSLNDNETKTMKTTSTINKSNTKYVKVRSKTN